MHESYGVQDLMHLAVLTTGGIVTTILGQKLYMSRITTQLHGRMIVLIGHSFSSPNLDCNPQKFALVLSTWWFCRARDAMWLHIAHHPCY
jgi:hypothetical protein